MFANLSNRITNAIEKLHNKELDINTLTEPLQEIRSALIEADVNLATADAIIAQVKARIHQGEARIKKLTPTQQLAEMVHDSILAVIGDTPQELMLGHQPTVILIAGLQGSGKTTSAAKLALYLREVLGIKETLLASTDVYRPQAIAQLKTLALNNNLNFFDPLANADHNNYGSLNPLEIAFNALTAARTTDQEGNKTKVLILDTAGRLSIDSAMMDEIEKIYDIVRPQETLFVVDAMAGQDAANVAKAFQNKLGKLTGAILTKTDSDTRGGAALSISHLAVPIKFMGVGEHIQDFETFDPRGIATRILDMGDVLSMVEKIKRNIDEEEAQKQAKKLEKGIFNFATFRAQLVQLEKLGGIQSMLSKMPGIGQIPPHLMQQVNEDDMRRIGHMIDSMTQKERKFPNLLTDNMSKNSRIKRIARGSGVDIPKVKAMLKQFSKMQKMMGKFSGKNMGSMLKKLQRNMPGE